MTEDTEAMTAAFPDVLARVLARHQWEFENRHYCTCGAEIRYTSPYSDDHAMADHQAAVVAAQLELGKETLNSDSAVYRWVSAWNREVPPERNLSGTRGACETCGSPIEKHRGIWQHTGTNAIRCRGDDGHAYPVRIVCETPGCYDVQPHMICEM